LQRKRPSPLNNVESFAYLRDVLERMSNGYPMGQLDAIKRVRRLR